MTMATKIKDGAEIEIREGGRRSIGTAQHCDCGAMCAVNVVALMRGTPDLPIVRGPLPEMYATESGDGYTCDLCTEARQAPRWPK